MATPSCAVPPWPWGETARGNIANSWADDQDVFAFQLTETTTVQMHIQTALASLYDGNGQRLHLADGGMDDGSWRLVKTLRPGVYFVKLEGSHGQEGPYSMKIQALRRSW